MVLAKLTTKKSQKFSQKRCVKVVSEKSIAVKLRNESRGIDTNKY